MTKKSLDPYQTVNFHFQVIFDFDSDRESNDVRFQSVTGLDSTLETEQIKEGGENLFTHVVPVRRKFGPLVLKRGLLKPEDSALTYKLKNCFQNYVFTPFKLVLINLLDHNHDTVMHWEVNNVWPTSWKIGELNAMQGAILIETLELHYNKLVFKDPQSSF